jgi:glycosyltransferase involved in cell wall biosynthesis
VNTPLAIYLDPVDFSQPLHGNGNAAIDRAAVKVVGNQFIYVGLTSHRAEVGRVVTREIEGATVSLYAIALAGRSDRMRLIPENLRFALKLFPHLRRIAAWETGAILTRTYTVMWLIALLPRRWSVCYYIPGLGNPMTIGRRPGLGRFLTGLYDWIQARALRRADVIFAAASRQNTEEYCRHMSYRGVQPPIQPLPTAVDVELFCPQPSYPAKEEFGVAEYDRVLTYVGRLAGVKGIPLLVESLKEVRLRGLNAALLLVGDGEERLALTALVEAMGIRKHVRFLGNQPPKVVARALAAADVFVMASFTEGFSNAMVEAVASGRPLVTTEVSGASDLIREGLNGFMVRERSPRVFADAIVRALELPDAERVSRELALESFSDQRLWRVIHEAWLRPLEVSGTQALAKTE